MICLQKTPINWGTWSHKHGRALQTLTFHSSYLSILSKKSLPWCWRLWCNGSKMFLLLQTAESVVITLINLKNAHCSHLHLSYWGGLYFLLRWNEPHPRSACPSPLKMTMSEVNIYCMDIIWTGQSYSVSISEEQRGKNLDALGCWIKTPHWLPPNIQIELNMVCNCWWLFLWNEGLHHCRYRTNLSLGYLLFFMSIEN